MENIFDLLELETQNVIKNCSENENPPFMIGGNENSLYTVTSDVTKEKKNLNMMKEQFNLKRQIRI